MSVSELFICATCGRSRPIRLLSGYSLLLARTLQPLKAVTRLDADDILCQSCALAVDNDVFIPASIGRTEVERFENSGVSLSPGRWVFIYLNY